MISVPLFDIDGNSLDPVEVDEKVLGGEVRQVLLREAVQMYEMNRHVCTKAQLTRGEVAGSTRKMYRQKHTGNARAGQRTVPQRRGGGRAFAASPRDLSYHMPKKARRNAAQSALLSRLLDQEVTLVKEIQADAPKTRLIAGMLKNIGIDGGCLLVVEGDNPNVWKSARNIESLSVCRVSDLNALALLERNRVLFTEAAFQKTLEVLG